MPGPQRQGELSQPILQTVLDALAAHACVLGPDGRVVLVNASWRRFAQDNDGELEAVGPGADYLGVCEQAARSGDETAARVAQGIRQVLSGERSDFRLEYPCHSPDTRRFFRLRCAPVGVTPVHALVVHENVSQLRNVLLELERAGERLRLAVEGTLDAYYHLAPLTPGAVADGEGLTAGATGPRAVPDFRVVDANDRAARHHDRDRCALIGARLSELYPPPAFTAFREALVAALASGRSCRRELRVGPADAPVRVEEQQLVPVDDGVVVFGRDVTDRHRVEREREQAVRRWLQAQKMEAVGRLAGGVAHDFNNLLTVIASNVDFLLDDGEPAGPAAGGPTLPHAARELVEEIGDAGERAGELTRQLLLFSRASAGTPDVVDLVDVVRGIAKLLRRVIGEDIDLETRIEAERLPVLANRSQLEQVILNLAVNARDAMPEGGALRLRLRSGEPPEAAGGGPVALLELSDTGVGMDQATLARIFEPFFTTKEPGVGTGLGLATVFAIVDAAGGVVDVDTAPGRGATFCVRLPLTQVAAADAGEGSPRRAEGGRERILLAEDDLQVRAVTTRILERSGYTVLPVAGGKEALRLVSERPVDLLVTDVVMPGMSGRELAAKLAADHPELPILFITGYTDDALIRNLGTSGRRRFLRKPFSPVGLTREVRSILDEAASRLAAAPRTSSAIRAHRPG
jgi:signal transduction histidine kinase/ActR/RegA family two-component response regulator